MPVGLGLPYSLPPCPSQSHLFQASDSNSAPSRKLPCHLHLCVTVHFFPSFPELCESYYFLTQSCKTIDLLKAWLCPYLLSGKSLSTRSYIRRSVSITSGHLPRSPLRGTVMSSWGVGRTGLLGFEELKSGSQPETEEHRLQVPRLLFITTSPPQRWALAVPFRVRACDFQILINAPWWKNFQAPLGQVPRAAFYPNAELENSSSSAVVCWIKTRTV